MWRLSERALAPVDETGPHAVGLRTDAIERVVGHEQATRAVFADQLFGFGIGLPVRLEVAGLLDRDHTIEAKADVRRGGIQHVAVAVGKNRELMSCAAQPFERRDDVREWF